MRNALRLAVAVAILAPALSLAQVTATAGVSINLPVVLPRLVVVSPGVQVVPGVDEEVFYSDGWYWARYDGGWYRSRHHRHGWAFVPPPRVPRRLVALPPGQYRRWHPPPRPVPAAYPAPPVRPAPAYPPPEHRDHGRGHDDRHHDDGRDRHDGHGGGNDHDGHGGRGNGHGKGHGQGHDRD